MEKYISFLYRNNYSQKTIATYKSILNNYIDDFNDIRNIKRKILSCSENPNTITTHYSIVHAYMKFKKDNRIYRLEEIKLPQKPMVYREVFTKAYLYRKTEDLTCQRKLLVRFLFETGLRAAELGNIIDFDKNSIKVLGKGNKIREVFHNYETTSQITSFKVNNKTLSRYVKETLGEKYTPHSIRRSHATHLLTNGANPKMVMMQLGHSNIETTFRYLQLSKQKNRSIYNKAF